MQAFETSEYRARLDNVRGRMSDAGLDALLVIPEGSQSYLTGYEAASAYVPQAALVTLDGDPYFMLRELDLLSADATCWLPQDRLFGYAEDYIGSAERSGWEAIGKFVKGKIGASARIGTELSGSGLGVADYARLVDALGVQELHDSSGLVSKCKSVKSERELSYMSEAAAIADRAMLAGIDKIAVGTRQCDVAATIMSALCSGTDTIPGGAPTAPAMPTGEIANAVHMSWTDDVYAAGQQTNFEIGGRRHRYVSALSRTAYVGSPTSRLKELHEGSLEGFHAALETIRPGVRCSEVARAFQAAVQPYGIKKASRMGYSIGVDWVDGGPSLATNDDTEIMANMTFHILIGFWERTETYMLSETVRVTEGGAESLSNVPRILFERPA